MGNSEKKELSVILCIINLHKTNMQNSEIDIFMMIVYLKG